MFDIERWQEIFEAISKNKLRTFLTGLSVGSGIFILIILLGISEGVRKGIKSQFVRDAETIITFWTNTTALEYKGLNPNRPIQLTTQDYEYAETRFEEDIEFKSTSYRRWGGLINYKEETGTYPIEGILPDMQLLQGAKLYAGRFISEKDEKEAAKVAVIGYKVAQELFKDYTKATGKEIEINNLNYKVIGVYYDAGGEWDNNKVYLPHSNIIKVYNSSNKTGAVWFTLNPEKNYDVAHAKSLKFIDQYVTHLKKEHQIHPNDTKAIQNYNSFEDQNIKNVFMITKIMRLFFWVIGILTLIAGVVGVANIMLIIVKERTKEIGIRKALGAQPKAIVAMILHESIFITTLSGFLGLFFALVVLEVVGPKIETKFILNPSVNFAIAVSAVLLLIAAGALAGFLPARHASKIKPIIALRDE